MTDPRPGSRTRPDPRPGSRPRRTALDLLLPGASSTLAGRPSGAVSLISWALLWTLALVRHRRIGAFVAGGSADERLAVFALALALAGIWAWTNLRPRSPEGPRPPNAAGSPAGDAPAGRSPWALAGVRFQRHRLAMAGLALLAGLSLVTLLVPVLAPHDPNAVNLATGRLLAPSPGHWMGTDELGRDILSRVLYGARISLSIGFLAVAIAVTLGTAVGGVAGYAGGRTDTVLMRIVDLFLSFPRLVLLITVVAVLEPSIGLIVVVLGLTGWMGVSRLVRGQVLGVREREYVQAARALGFRPSRVLLRHVLPNVLTPVIVAATLGIGNAILAEAALSYLGLGVQPPTASWGNIIQSGGDRIVDAWWIATFPGLAIVLTVVSFNLVGDGLRDALDPRHAQ